METCPASVHLNTTQLLKITCKNTNIPPVCVVMGTCPALSTMQLLLKFKCENIPSVCVVMELHLVHLNTTQLL